METYRFDLYNFVHDLGGPMACYRRLRAMQVPVQPRTLNKWLYRDNIDITYLANLLAHEALNGTPVDINKYILPVEDPDGLRVVRSPTRAPSPPAAAPAA